jgi:hypothetical protein
MKSLKLHLLLIGCMLVGLCSRAWATELQFGQTVTGTISAAAQTNSYTFSANAGDVIDITMTTTSGSLNPKIQLLTSGGTPIDTVKDPNCFAGPQEMNTVRLPLSPPIGIYPAGTYVVTVGDCGDANTGAYALYIQRTNNPGGPVPLPFGKTLTGKIGLPAQNNTYTFIANAGDVVDITMTTTLGALNPKIRLYRPGGALLSSVSDPNCFSGPQEMNTITLPVSGTYAVLVADCGDTNAGSYSVFAQRTNNPALCVDLLWGQTQASTISSAAQSNCYTFSGTARDVIDIHMTATSGSLNPKIRLYRPGGALLSSVSDPNCFSGPQEMNNVMLPTTGPYTVLVGDCGDTNTGNYDLSSLCFGVCLQPVPGPITISPISVEEGSANITLTVMGSNFFPDSVVEWNGVQLKTTYVSSTKLTAIIPAADLKVPGPYSVRVFTPPPGGGLSPSVPFTVLGPVISSLVPSNAIARGPAFTLTVNGAGFVSTSVVRWAGTPLRTNYVSPKELQALVPALDIAVAGIFPITVANGPIVSPPFNFTVDNPPPGVTSLSPSSIIVGGSAFTLIVRGSGFVPGSLVEWKGTALTTIFVNSMELEGEVLASDIVSGIVPITVHSTSPGGGTSGGLNLTINNPVPVLSSLSQNSVAHGTASLTLTVKGLDFNEGARVLWNGAALATTFVSDTQLTATVPAADIAAAGKATITVTNPAPTPGASNAITFTIN